MCKEHKQPNMQTPSTHVRTFGNGAVVQVTFDALSIEPRIVQVAAACNNQFTVTHATAKQVGSLRKHNTAWIKHARDHGQGTGKNVMWLLTAQPETNSVSVRELMLAMQALQQLPDLQIGVLMRDEDISAFVQHWVAADGDDTTWSQLHLFKNVIGLHAFVASRITNIEHVCAVSGAIGHSVSDMYVSDKAALHAVVQDGSFVYNVPQQWPMAVVHEDMPMLAAENCTAFVQTRGEQNERCSAIEIRQKQTNVAYNNNASKVQQRNRVRLLYISSFCAHDDVLHPVQWLRDLLQNDSDAMALKTDPLLLSLVLRATVAHVPSALKMHTFGGPCTRQPTSVTSPHLHRSITQQMHACGSKI
ncbi:MAG: hypothetical protein CMM87_06910 [Rickettsiales bacterium]|nr:hypothetical protein [Rickettsiales bacterium]